MATQKEMLVETIAGIERHESECNIKYAHIKEQLSDGSKKFIRLENIIWGLYVLIISGGVAIIGQLI